MITIQLNTFKGILVNFVKYSIDTSWHKSENITEKQFFIVVTRAKLNLMKTENFVSSEVFIYKIFVRTLELSELSV